MAMLEVFVSTQGGAKESIEVPATGTVRSIIDEAQKVLKIDLSGVTFQGEMLDPAHCIADTGVSREALLEAVGFQPIRFSQQDCGLYLEVSADKRRVANREM
eukprot:Hpha_TRINITY_DN8352_c0_g1::TRINITY_DN8352_c0_g1_i1::g.154328::m.154328